MKIKMDREPYWRVIARHNAGLSLRLLPNPAMLRLARATAELHAAGYRAEGAMRNFASAYRGEAR